MLDALDVEQARFIALLAKAARAQRDDLLGNTAEDDLAPLNAARGEHNPTALLALDPLRPDASQTEALREAIGGLSVQARGELYTLMRIGQGDLAAKKWHRGLTEAGLLGDAAISGAIVDDPDLHDHIMKGLYEVGAASP
ncbi:MAG TPA: DUF3775 domain-containing protein [Bradyrhizobium sp.]|nr:DUF3775 domain-containing protein [Bradyrhizobium sp.]